MTTLTAIQAAIVAALAADLGTFDLSATDQVKEGTYQMPPGSTAFAAVEPIAVTDSEPQGRARWFRRRALVTIRLWAPYTAETTGDRAARARLLLHEAAAALDAARRVGTNALYRCQRFLIRSAQPDPAAANAPSTWASGALVVELTFLSTSGFGG